MRIKILSLLFLLANIGAASAEMPESDSKIERLARALAGELAQSCPLAKADDQMAFDSCRRKLFSSPLLDLVLNDDLLWGQQDASKPFYQLNLTHFDKHILAGLYLPLFMFPGTYRIDRNKEDFWLQIHIDTIFRNRLMAGQFPYPFWHDPKKWNAYQEANEILFRVDPATLRVTAALRVKEAKAPLADIAKIDAPSFDGQWMWIDANGKEQPAVTLFDGLFSSANPFKPALAASYRDLALALRQDSCTSCHNPSNPSKMLPLVLMQTPAHAAGEAHRIIDAIEKNEMPLTDSGTKKELDPAEKEQLLRKARAFAAIVDQAFAWEKQQP